MFPRHLSKRSNQFVVLTFGVALAFGMLTSTGGAQSPRNKKTTVTFSQSVEIPGAGAQVLPAGTYVFKLLDSESNRHIVQILNENESQIYATILAIPNYRLQATDKTVITFGERMVGTPQAIRGWFHPGDTVGQEFVYPRTKAIELARRTNQPVLYVPDEVAPNMVAPIATVNDPPVIALKEAPLKAVQPTGTDVSINEVVVLSPPMQASSLSKTADTLPETAGALPLVALIGILSLTGAFTLRALWPR